MTVVRISRTICLRSSKKSCTRSMVITSFWAFRLFAAGVFGCEVFVLSGMNLISYSDPKSVPGNTQWISSVRGERRVASDVS